MAAVVHQSSASMTWTPRSRQVNILVVLIVVILILILLGYIR